MDAFIERQIASFGGRRYAIPSAAALVAHKNLVHVRIRDNRLSYTLVDSPDNWREPHSMKVLAEALRMYPVKDTTLLVCMSDEYFQRADLPTFSFAVPDGRPGLIFPNFDMHHFTVGEEAVDYDRVGQMARAYRPPAKHVAPDIYFKGKRTSAGRTYAREMLAKERAPLRVHALEDCNEPVFKAKNHKYVIDLCGWVPWSLRLKYLFLLSRAVIRVSFFDPAKGETSFFRQHFDYLFAENEDYVHLVYQLNYKKRVPAELFRKMVADIRAAHAHFEAHPEVYAAMVERMEAARRALTLRCTARYLSALIDRYTEALLEPEPEPEPEPL